MSVVNVNCRTVGTCQNLRAVNTNDINQNFLDVKFCQFQLQADQYVNYLSKCVLFVKICRMSGVKNLADS